MRNLLCKAAVVLANGYVLFFFSERAFWSFWRPGDNVRELLLTWLVYCLLGWMFLILVRRYRIASFPPLFLAGAVFGWVAEGVVVDTLYGNATNPFPLSISFTGLAWHALLSVGVGWYLIGKALTEWSRSRVVALSIAIGLGWGLWAVWWPTELGQQADTSVRAFAGHALACTAPFLVAWLVFGLARPDWFQPRKAETAVLSSLVVLVFLAARVPAMPAAALILPPLLLLCGMGLRRNALQEQRLDLLDGVLGRARLGHVLVLVLIPVAAIVTYAPFSLLNLPLPTNVVLYVITMPLGFWFFFRSLWVAFRPGVKCENAGTESGVPSAVVNQDR